jgi:hypothetical protein
LFLITFYPKIAPTAGDGREESTPNGVRRLERIFRTAHKSKEPKARRFGSFDVDGHRYLLIAVRNPI